MVLVRSTSPAPLAIVMMTSPIIPILLGGRIHLRPAAAPVMDETVSGLTDDDKRRIAEFANKNWLDRSPDDLRPEED